MVFDVCDEMIWNERTLVKSGRVAFCYSMKSWWWLNFSESSLNYRIRRKRSPSRRSLMTSQRCFHGVLDGLAANLAQSCWWTNFNKPSWKGKYHKDFPGVHHANMCFNYTNSMKPTVFYPSTVGGMSWRGKCMAIGLKMVHGPQRLCTHAGTDFFVSKVWCSVFFVFMKVLPILNFSMLPGGCRF